MTSNHDRLRQLVLAFEELTAAERNEAQAHLATCAECRRLLERFQLHERAPGPRGELSAQAMAASPRPGTHESAAAEASLAALRLRVAAANRPAAKDAEANPRGIALPARPRLRWARWLVPAAAAAAVLVVLALPRRAARDPLRDAALVHAGSLRGEALGGVAPDSLWRVGDAFEVKLELDAPGWPMLVHVGADGVPQLLYPDTGPAAAPRLGPGLQVLRPMDPGVEWEFEGEPAAEDFLVAVAVRRSPDRAVVARELQRAGEEHADSAARLEAVRRVLAKHAGPARAFRIHPRR